jgi:hypothetical protein
VLSVIKNQKPRDHIEAMLVAQTAVAHLAMMRFADELSPRTTHDRARWEFALKALTSFGRTFATQVSALKQYRSGGEQRVTVRHVSVSDGAQASDRWQRQQSTGDRERARCSAISFGWTTNGDGAYAGARTNTSLVGTIR